MQMGTEGLCVQREGIKGERVKEKRKSEREGRKREREIHDKSEMGLFFMVLA
jgi:hypothetical protein